MILACCISPARSPAEARNRMLETADRMLGMAIAAITITTNKTINSSMMLNPPLRSRRGCFLLGSILILVSNSLVIVYGTGLSGHTPALTTGMRGHFGRHAYPLYKSFCYSNLWDVWNPASDSRKNSVGRNVTSWENAGGILSYR